MIPDEQTRKNVENELEWEPNLESKAILVKVHQGVVTLGGRVPHYSDRCRAEEATKRVHGVLGIANELEVHIPKAGERSDADIANAAVNALIWKFAVSASKIKPIVVHGRVTLVGEVEYGYQSDIAERAVRFLTGVRAVHNQLVVKPQVKLVDVERKITAAFERQAHLDSKNITVRVDGGEVTLEGVVQSVQEKEDAMRAAFAAPGVSNVKNNLKVQYI